MLIKLRVLGQRGIYDRALDHREIAGIDNEGYPPTTNCRVTLFTQEDAPKTLDVLHSIDEMVAMINAAVKGDP